MSTILSDAARSPLTILSDDEQMFREAVRDFALSEVGPRVREMDEAGRLDPELLPKLFEIGVMGVEIPDRFGGAGSTFFTSVLVVEELSRVDPSVGVLVDVQNTLVVNALNRWGSDEQKERFFPRLATDVV